MAETTAPAGEGSRVLPVILSGGSGTRLWPLSSKARPKQFLKLVGERTMLQHTALRTADPILFAPPLVVGNADHERTLVDQLEEIGTVSPALILEPHPRNTAPAIALAACAVPADTLLMIMPSDHVVQDSAALLRAVETARPLALQDWLVTFGIRADRPETGFGYIRRGDEIGDGAFRVDRFVEKPDAATAQAYVDDGHYSWNGGIFMMRAGRYLEALRDKAPEVLAAAEAAIAGAERSNGCIRPDASRFAASPSISIDYAVLEKDDRVAVIPIEMGWSDIGCWDAVYDLRALDEAGNAVAGPSLLLDTRNCLVQSSGPKIVTIGVEDLIIVASDEGILVMPKGTSQRVKDIAEPLP